MKASRPGGHYCELMKYTSSPLRGGFHLKLQPQDYIYEGTHMNTLSECTCRRKDAHMYTGVELLNSGMRGPMLVARVLLYPNLPAKLESSPGLFIYRHHQECSSSIFITKKRPQMLF